MHTFRFLETSLDEFGVARVSLNRGPANAVDVEMYREIRALFSDIDQLGDNVRAVVLDGKGRHFCAGNDLDEFATMAPDNASERMWNVRMAFFSIAECRVPVIGAIHGAALGTGLCFAAACDFVVASTDARFGLPEMTVGVMGGARHLKRIAPEPLVRRMFFTSEHLLAQEFRDGGAAILVRPPEEFREEACRLARRIAGFSPTAVRVGKQILDRVEWMDIRSGYEYEQAGTERMSGHPDAAEALAAFREKREPQYQPIQRQNPFYGA